MWFVLFVLDRHAALRLAMTIFTDVPLRGTKSKEEYNAVGH